MPAAWAARSQESRACRSSWASIDICRRHFGKIHPKWRTPWVSILVQAVISGVDAVDQPDQRIGARRVSKDLVDITIIIYFIPFLYMFAAVIKLANRPDRLTNPNAVLIPGGKFGVWLTAGIGFLDCSCAHGDFRCAAGRFGEQISVRGQGSRRDRRGDFFWIGFVLARRARETVRRSGPLNPFITISQLSP